MRYILYNDDQAAAEFEVCRSQIESFRAVVPPLLPMQIRSASADGFTMWIRDRAIDLNAIQHRNLVHELYGSRDKLSISLTTHMFSISDTFTCFPEGEFIPRSALCNPQEQEMVSQFILVSSDTSLRHLNAVTPNVATDGSFTKTWVYENDSWWLYKLQSSDATRTEVEISRVLRTIGWDAAEYRYIGSYRKRVRSKNFLGSHEFFEPYDSLRFMFHDVSDDDDVISENIASLGEAFRTAWKRILAADAFFMNTDRHMRNFGVIRSSKTGDILRLAPNFDNNQAYRANPGNHYSVSMLKYFLESADEESRSMIGELADACRSNPYLKDASEQAAKL